MQIISTTLQPTRMAQEHTDRELDTAEARIHFQKENQELLCPRCLKKQSLPILAVTRPLHGDDNSPLILWAVCPPCDYMLDKEISMASWLRKKVQDILKYALSDALDKNRMLEEKEKQLQESNKRPSMIDIGEFEMKQIKRIHQEEENKYGKLENCIRCGKVSPYIEKGPFGPHKAKMVCSRCATFLRWCTEAEAALNQRSTWFFGPDLSKEEEIVEF